MGFVMVSLLDERIRIDPVETVLLLLRCVYAGADCLSVSHSCNGTDRTCVPAMKS